MNRLLRSFDGWDWACLGIGLALAVIIAAMVGLL